MSYATEKINYRIVTRLDFNEPLKAEFYARKKDAVKNIRRLIKTHKRDGFRTELHKKHGAGGYEIMIKGVDY